MSFNYFVIFQSHVWKKWFFNMHNYFFFTTVFRVIIISLFGTEKLKLIFLVVCE